MKRMMMTALLSLLAATMTVAAEPTQGGFWDGLRAKVEKVTPRKKTSGGTAVGGVRSARQQDAELYWKGKEQALEADEEEIEVFKQALRKAAGGEREESARLFEAFLGNYPHSQLKADCLKALEQLRQEK